jgi:hypothetical protein
MSQKRHSLVGAGLASPSSASSSAAAIREMRLAIDDVMGVRGQLVSTALARLLQTVIPNQDERLGEIVSANWR